jgi:hypothetical protein
MITVQMADANMIDAVEIYPIFHELHLRPFATVNQKNGALNFNELRRRVTSVCRKCSTGTQDCDLETHVSEKTKRPKRLVLVRCIKLLTEH